MGEPKSRSGAKGAERGIHSQGRGERGEGEGEGEGEGSKGCWVVASKQDGGKDEGQGAGEENLDQGVELGGGGGEGEIGKDDELWVIDPGCNGVCCITFEGAFAPDPVRSNLDPQISAQQSSFAASSTNLGSILVIADEGVVCRVLSILWEMAAEQGSGKGADAFAKEHHACHRFLPMQVKHKSKT